VLQLRPTPDEQVDVRREEEIERMTRLWMVTRFLDSEDARPRAEQTAERRSSSCEFVDVVDDDSQVGFVWWGRDGTEAQVFDVRLDEPKRVPELIPACLERARQEGASRLGLSAVPDDPTRAELMFVDGATPRATNMALALDQPIADPGTLELRPMAQDEFDAYMEISVDGYAAELAAAGMTREAAAARSREQMDELIPSGLDSPDMSFFTAWSGETPVGRLWIFTGEPMAFVYDVEVHEAQRRKGYGAGIMNAGAIWCRDLGHPAIGLNVFAHNPHARALYDKLGYRVTNEYLTLDVADA
jgi:GNAT superfamily N-acetyltransferase